MKHSLSQQCIECSNAAARLPRRPNGKLSQEGVRALVTSGKENP